MRPLVQMVRVHGRAGWAPRRVWVDDTDDALLTRVEAVRLLGIRACDAQAVLASLDHVGRGVKGDPRRYRRRDLVAWDRDAA